MFNLKEQEAIQQYNIEILKVAKIQESHYKIFNLNLLRFISTAFVRVRISAAARGRSRFGCRRNEEEDGVADVELVAVQKHEAGPKGSLVWTKRGLDKSFDFDFKNFPQIL